MQISDTDITKAVNKAKHQIKEIERSYHGVEQYNEDLIDRTAFAIHNEVLNVLRRVDKL